MFTLALKYIDKKAERAKEVVAANTAQVEANNRTIEGMAAGMGQERIAYDRRIALLEVEKAELQKDLIEEKAINLTIERENARLRELVAQFYGKEIDNYADRIQPRPRALSPAEEAEGDKGPDHFVD